jgi:hypothetical protein
MPVAVKPPLLPFCLRLVPVRSTEHKHMKSKGFPSLQVCSQNLGGEGLLGFSRWHFSAPYFNHAY